ncbi:MAG: S41 family peptidase [Gammaproteobacteria bacterium]
MRKQVTTVLAWIWWSCASAGNPGGGPDAFPGLLEADRISIRAGRQDVVGVWRSRGYGWVLEISGTGQRQYEIGDFGCYPRPASVEGATPMLSVRFSDYRLSQDGRMAMFIYGPDNVGPVFDRLDALPAACESPPGPDMEDTLEVFLSIMTEHYAHFERRGVDWGALSAETRRIFYQDRTADGLVAAFRHTIDALQDSHTRVIALSDEGPQRIASGLGPTLTRIRQADGETRWLVGIVEQLTGDILDPGARHVGRDRILWGTIGTDIGYLQIFQMGGFTELDISDPDWAKAELETMDRLLDEAFSHFSGIGVRAVILDLSNNRGGYDEIARRLAARFAAEPFHAYSVSARGSGLPPLPKLIEPAPDNRFRGPTYVLTSDVTVSGGEIATLALKQLPNVVQAGTATRGAFSTPLAKALPNGWIVELANEEFSAPDGEVYTGRGLPPDWQLPVFEAGDPVASHGGAVRTVAARAGLAGDE